MTDVMGTNAISYTPAIMANQMISGLNTAEAQQANDEEQLSTGSTINQPSDNPAGAAQILQLNASLARAQQYSSNASDAQGWLSLGNSTMNQIISTLQQAKQVVESVSGANLSNQPGSLQALADQVVVHQDVLAQPGQHHLRRTGDLRRHRQRVAGLRPERQLPGGRGGADADRRPRRAGVGRGDRGAGVRVRHERVCSAARASWRRSPRTCRPGPTRRSTTCRRPTSRRSTRPSTQVTAQAATMGANYQQVQAFSQQATNTATGAPDADVGHRQHERRPGHHPAHASRSSRSRLRCGPRRSCRRTRSSSSWDDRRGRRMLITQVRPKGPKAKTTAPQTPSGESLSSGDRPRLRQRDTGLPRRPASSGSRGSHPSWSRSA